MPHCPVRMSSRGCTAMRVKSATGAARYSAVKPAWRPASSFSWNARHRTGIPRQAELTEPVREAITSILGIDASSLQVINRPPTRSKPIYMKVWEARKADGLDYDPDDERQQAFLSEITKYNIRSIE